MFWAAAVAAAISIVVALTYVYLPRDSVGSTCARGGGSFASSIVPLELERLPAISDIALIGSIEDVSPTRVSTPSGKLEVERWRDPDVVPYTPVTVRIEEILGVRPRPEFPLPRDVALGDQIVVTEIGGCYTAELSPEQDRALGRENVEHDRGQQPVEGAGRTVTMSLSTDVSLSEGDRVVLFLRYGPLFEGLLRSYWIAGGAAWTFEWWGGVVPATEAVDGLDVDVGLLRDYGLALNLQAGPAEDPIPEASPEP